MSALIVWKRRWRRCSLNRRNATTTCPGSAAQAVPPVPTSNPTTAAPLRAHSALIAPIITPAATLPTAHSYDLPPPFTYVYPPPTNAMASHGQPLYGPRDGASSYTHQPHPPPAHSLPPFSMNSVSFHDTWPFVGDSGPRRGPGPSGDRPWLSGPDYRLRKLKMLIFDGTDAFGWVYQLERYFEKLCTAALCMEGQALAWYRWAEGRTPFRHWEELKARLLERFQPSHEGDIYEQFLALEQEGSVREYIGAFETLAAQLVNIPEKVMKGTFTKGLKSEIRSSVRMLQPTGLTAMIKTALLSEEGRSTNIEDQARGVARVSPPPPLLGNMGPKPVTETTRPPLKRMTEAEILEKRAKGLCSNAMGGLDPTIAARIRHSKFC